MKKSIFFFIVLNITFLIGCSSSESQVKESSAETTDTVETPEDNIVQEESINGIMRDMSPKEFVLNMGSGWNLGNTLDTEDVDVTAWGNPLTTQTMIDEIAAKGFKTLRLPVTWRFHTGAAPGLSLIHISEPTRRS